MSNSFEETNNLTNDCSDFDLNAEIITMSEKMGININQLLWLLDDSMKTFQNIRNYSTSIEENTHLDFASMQKVSEFTGEWKESLKLFNESVTNIENNVDKATDMLDVNKTIIENVGVFLREVKIINDKYSKNNEELQNFSKKIDEIIVYIHEISKKTKLLAINASIEAARSGNSGKGFAVVAEEIQKMSYETEVSASEIEQIISNIAKGINESNKITTMSNEQVGQVDEVITETVNAISELSYIMKILQDSTVSLKSITDQQNLFSQTISKAVDTVKETIGHTRSAALVTIDKVEEQQEKNQVINDNYKDLIVLSEDFQKITMRLKGEKELFVGVNPFTSPENIKKMYVPILESVFNDIGYKVRIIILRDYESICSSIEENIIDVGWFSPFAYVYAHDNTGVEPIATPIVKGKTSYKGCIITRDDSGIEDLQQLKQKRFGFVDKRSASGYIYANKILQSNRINADSFFSATSFLGSHDNIIRAVINGEVDAGATYDEGLENYMNNGNDISSIKIIAYSNEIPKDAIVVNKGISDELKQELKESFLKYSDTNNSIQGFKDNSNERYDIVREASKQ
jgi:phosphate/phosphite/phosphonate ABC transporter binding protein